MQRKLSQVVSREWTFSSTIYQEQVQSCRIQSALTGLVRAAALPLLHAVEETTTQWFGLHFGVLISTNASVQNTCVLNYFSHF